MYDYPIQIHDDPDGLWLTCPDTPRTYGAGENMAKAIASLRDGLESVFSLYVDENQPIPAASAPAAGQPFIRLPVEVSMKVAVWNAFLASGLSKSELARRLGVNRPQIDRLFDFLHHSKMDALERALHELGFSVEVSIRAA